MNISLKLAAALLASAALSASAAEATLLLSMKIERNGELISSPKLLVEYGKEAAVQVSDEFRLELSAADLGKSADLRMNLKTNQGGDLRLAASPRIFATFASEAAIQITDQLGVVYRVTVTPTRVSKPI